MILSFDVKTSLRLLVLEFEGDGEVEVRTNGNTIVLARLPLRHLLNDAESLAVEVFVHTLGDSGLTD